MLSLYEGGEPLTLLDTDLGSTLLIPEWSPFGDALAIAGQIDSPSTCGS